MSKNNKRLKLIPTNMDIVYLYLLTLITFAVYTVSINYPFLENFDDNGYVTQNPYLSFSLSDIKYWFTHACVGCYLPLTMLSYMFDYAIWGLNSFGYHLQNIFWHIVAVIAIYKCFRLFKIKTWIAFFLCLIFAVHPQRVESVVWISERKDVLCAAFYFLSIYFYIKKSTNKFDSSNKFPVLSFIFFILAILSKPMAISLPVILLIYEWHRLVESGEWRVASGQWSVISRTNDKSSINNTQLKKQRNKTRALSPEHRVPNTESRTPNQQIRNKIRDFYKLIPFFIILIIFIPISVITQSNADAIQQTSSIFSLHRLFSVLYNIYWYFTQTLFCTENSPLFHPHIINFYSMLELILFYTGIIIILVYIYTKNKNFFFVIFLPLILTYLITLLPVSGIIKLGPTDHADRYSYIPSVFIWFSIGLVLTQVKFKKILLFCTLTCYSLTLTILNIQYQLFWKNYYKLFSYANTYYNVNAHVLIGLADIEMDRKNYIKVLELTKVFEGNKHWKPIADYYKAAILFNIDRNKSINPLKRVKSEFERNLYRKSFKIKYPIIMQMLNKAHLYL